MALSHHELCFGCGSANLFGLQLELERDGGGVTGRFFVKQDLQGPPGVAHGGVMAAALDEAMSLAVHAEGARAWTRRLTLELLRPAPVGAFVRLEARIDGSEERELTASAVALSPDDGTRFAEARGTFVAPAGEQAPR